MSSTFNQHQLPAGLLHDDIKLVIDRIRGHAVYRFIHVDSGKHYDMGFKEFYLLLSLAHRNSAQETITHYQQRFDEPLSQSDIISFKDFILQSGLFKQEFFSTHKDQKEEDEGDLFSDETDFEQETSALKRKKKQAPMFHLFNPNQLFSTIAHLLHPLHYTLYLLPLILIISLITLNNNFPFFQEDFLRLWAPATIIQHLLFSLLTVNLLSKISAGVTSRYYGAEVKKFGIVLVLGVIPRFFVDLRDARQLPHQARLWVFASALLMKLAIFTFAILLWETTRNSGTLLPLLGIALSITCIISFIITANPLVTSDGYRWLTELLKEKNLLPRAYRMLFSVFNRRRETPINFKLLAYAIASILYITLIGILILIIVGSSLVGALKGVGFILLLMFIIYNAQRIYHNIQLRHDERKNTTKPDIKIGDKKEMAWYQHFVQTRQHLRHSHTLLSILLISLLTPLLFTPYLYESSGRVEVISSEQQQIHSPLAGIIEKVYFNGGEYLEAGTVVAKLDDYQQRSDLAIIDAKINQQQAVTEYLESLPRDEESLYYLRRLQRTNTQLQFSEQRLAQYEQLYQAGMASFNDREQAQEQYDLDIADQKEARAELSEIISGIHSEQLNAEKIELDRLYLERDYLRKQLAHTELRMPFNGVLSSVQLFLMRGQYIEAGGFFAQVEAPDHVIIEIKIPENEIPDITLGATTRLKLISHPRLEFFGEVISIEAHVSEESLGVISRVLARIENPDLQIKPGMSGHAKIVTHEIPLWNSISKALIRFVMVELWSWVP